MFKKIFVAYDHSDVSQQALRFAVQLHDVTKSQLIVVHVAEHEEVLKAYQLVNDTDRMITTLDEKISQEIATVIGKNHAAKNIKIISAWGPVMPTLLSEIKKNQPDLVVVGTHATDGIKHFLWGGVAENLVRHVSCPVVIVRGQCRWPFKKILVPVDFGDMTEDLVFTASQLATQKAALALLHVISLPDVVWYAPTIASQTRDDITDRLVRHSQMKLQELLKKHGQLPATAKTLVGKVADEICREAEALKADLILVSTHGRGSLSHLFLGSVTESIIRHAPCSVMTFCPKHEQQGH